MRRALIQYIKQHPTSPYESFSIHPVVDSVSFISFGKGKYELESDRPRLRRQGEPVSIRPKYQLIRGEIKNDIYLHALIRAVDDWVFKNLE